MKIPSINERERYKYFCSCIKLKELITSISALPEMLKEALLQKINIDLQKEKERRCLDLHKEKEQRLEIMIS